MSRLTVIFCHMALMLEVDDEPEHPSGDEAEGMNDEQTTKSSGSHQLSGSEKSQ